MSYDNGYDDEYDDESAYDAYDAYGQQPRSAPQMGDAEVILSRAIDIIASAPNMPLSSTPRIDRDEIIELLQDALARLPEELR